MASSIGHLSVRNPDDPATFFMMRQLAPAAVSRLEDIGEYRISDAEPVDTSTPVAPLERYIHNEVLKRYSDVNVVLHGHPEELVAYGISSVKLRPVIHMAPFLGMPDSMPFTLTDTCSSGTCAYALIQVRRFPFLTLPSITNQTTPEIPSCTTSVMGAALAAEFEGFPTCSFRDGTLNGIDNHNPYPAHNLVLMQSHGFAAVAADIKIATYQGIYAVTNAKVQSEALKIQHAFTGQAAQGADGIVSLDGRQIRDSWATERRVIEKPWAQWVKEVRVDPLYLNEAVPGTCG